MSETKKKPDSDSDTFALWLKPENEVYDALKRIIDSLSDTYGAPRFDPHITVAGNITKPAEAVEKTVLEVAAQSEPMTLYLTETDYRDTLYQSLFIHTASNDALLALRERCLSGLRLEHKPYMPHISLLYKKLETAEKDRIIEQVGSRFDFVFSPDKLYMMRTTGPPDQWEEVMYASLNN